MNDVPMTTALKHFLKLARRGFHGGGASGGEVRAMRLAEAVRDDVPGIDGQAIDGLIEYIRIAAAKPSTARDLCPE